MGLWPARAREAVAAAQAPARVQASEGFPSASNVYELTSGAPVRVSGVYEAPVTRDLALSVPAILRGVTLKATTIAGLPLERYDAAGQRVDLGWLTQPEAGRPRFNTMTDTVIDLQLEGRAYWIIHDRDPFTRQPALGGCEYVEIARTGTVQDRDGRTVLLVDSKPVDPRDVIGFHGWHDGILRHGARTIRTAIALEAAARRYADTPLPAVTLVNESGYEMDDDEIDKLLLDYKAGRNQEGVSYVNNGVKPVINAFDAAQLQLVEARQFANTSLANLLEMPAQYIAGAAASSGGAVTYANVTQDARALIDYGLKSPAQCVEARLSLGDVTGTDQARISMDALLRGNPLERAQLYAQLIPLGVLTVDEARAMEDLAPTGGIPA